MPPPIVARTITGNGLGTDHGWGGHYPLIGGGILGGQVLGEYWPDMSDNFALSLGRGRIIPTLPWDAQWHAIAQWMGVVDHKLVEVLPNLHSFAAHQLINRTQLFSN